MRESISESIYLVPLILILLPLFLLPLPPERLWAKLLAGITTIISLSVLGWVTFILDDLMQFPHSLIFCAIMIAAAACINLPLLIRYRSKPGCVLMTVFCVVVLVMDYRKADSKTFKQAYAQIHEGMTEQEASLAVRAEFSAGSYSEPDFLRDEKSGRIEYLFPHAPNGKVLQGGYEAFIILKLKDGRIESKRYDND